MEQNKDQWIEGKAKIIYEPDRPGMKRRTDWWCVAIIDREITRYLRWHTVKNVPNLRLHNPAWDGHISVIRGEKPDSDKMHLWKKYHRKIVPFWYNLDIKNNGHFFFVKVIAPFLSGIREEMDKPCNWPLHITIGRTWDVDYKRIAQW